MQVTIELPETVEVTAGEAVVEFDWAKLPKDRLAEFVARAACVGVAKAGNDSASGAKAYAEKHTLEIEAAREELIASWIEARYKSADFGRVAGVGDSAEIREAKSILRGHVKKMQGAKYNKASPEERDAMVEKAWESIGDQRESLMETARAELARKREESQRRADAVKSIGDLKITL